MALLFCALGFVACFLLGRRSLAAGLGGVLTWGYLYGILRANFLDGYAHFIFDAAVVGFYLSQLNKRLDAVTAARVRPLRQWVIVLIGWTGIMFLMPLQHILVQLVGLRGNAFLVPFLLFGGRLQTRDLGALAVWMAVLNGVALGFGGAEFFLGVPAFYPLNPVTELIYNSNDVAGYTALRIPACFANAHAYAGTMVSTLPWLVGGLVQVDLRLWRRGLLLAGVGAAVLGVFMTATRVNIVLMFTLLLIAAFSGRLRGAYWFGLLLVLAGVGYIVSGEQRFQRFLTLQDTDKVVGRIEGSVNMSFGELLVTYPIGNGMGAGGTSIPYFLQYLIRNPIGMENEYSRILLEQGIVGLVLWVIFIGWALSRRGPPAADHWFLSWRLLWIFALGNFALSALGTGLMAAIPQTAILFLGVGHLATRVPGPETTKVVSMDRAPKTVVELARPFDAVPVG